MSANNSSSSQFPSGIPDPPIFAKLGPKDRSRLRQNIEAHAAKERELATMSNEQTYVWIFCFHRYFLS